MKKILLLAALVGMAVTSFGQGVVQFNNKVSASGVDAPITGVTGAKIDESLTPGYRAALYGIVGSIPGSDSALDNQILVSSIGSGNTWVNFRTGAAAGYINTAGDAGRMFASGGFSATVTVQVRAWFGNYSTYEAARAAGAPIGKSNMVQMTTTTSATDTSVPAIVGLQGFQVVPEPSSIALGLLGLGAIAMIRRRK
jgi:MYXO-CTERM domain-containing protein